MRAASSLARILRRSIQRRSLSDKQNQIIHTFAAEPCPRAYRKYWPNAIDPLIRVSGDSVVTPNGVILRKLLQHGTPPDVSGNTIPLRQRSLSVFPSLAVTPQATDTK